MGSSSGYNSADISGRANSPLIQGPCSVIAHPVHISPTNNEADGYLVGVLEFIKNCDEDATAVETFNMEDEEIVDSKRICRAHLF